jgi:hypothetical protein
MVEKQNPGALYSLFEASMWEFPLALQKWMTSMGRDGHEVEEAVLKACHAWTNLANESVDRVYQARGFVGLMTASVRHFVQWQRVTREFAENLMPGVRSGGAQTAGPEIEELRESVAKLRRDVRQLTAKVNLRDGLDETRNGAGARR